MQAQKFPDFNSFMEDLAPIIAVAPDEDVQYVEDSETVVLVRLNPIEDMLDFYVVRPDGLMANFPFLYANRAADDDGWEQYSEIGNDLFSFLVDEEAEAHGAEEPDYR